MLLQHSEVPEREDSMKAPRTCCVSMESVGDVEGGPADVRATEAMSQSSRGVVGWRCRRLSGVGGAGALSSRLTLSMRSAV
jgi:hypothetical protein